MFAPATVETPAHRMLALHRRLRELREGPRATNPWQASFRKFLTECVLSKDEERAGRMAPLPDHRYFDDFADALITCPKLFVEKSRRVMASWVVCAFDLWVAAGGIDPRWPALTLSTQNRRVVICAQKLEGDLGSHWFLHERVRFIADHLPEMGIREKWPEFPTFTWTYDLAKGSNGARISAVPQGAHQSRGGGASLIHNEEFAFWPQAKDTLMAQLPCTLNGGKIVIVTTPQVASVAKDIRDGVLRERS